MILNSDCTDLIEKASDFWTAMISRFLRPARLMTVGCALFGMLYIFFQWVSHWSRILAIADSFYFAVFVVWVLAVLIVALPAFPFLVVGLLLPRVRKTSALVLMLCYAAIATAYGSMMIGDRIHLQYFEGMATRSKPLITAIHAYETRYHQPPAKLAALAPEFLKKLPKTGIGSSPEFRYRIVTPESDEFKDNGQNPWVLEVNAIRPFSHNYLVYYPRQNYPLEKQRQVFEKIDGWAYVRE